MEREVHPFSKAGSDVVESAAILTEFATAPHKHWTELAERMHDTELPAG